MGTTAIHDHRLEGRAGTFCPGCQQRPVFTALAAIAGERGHFQVAVDSGCTALAAAPPFDWLVWKPEASLAEVVAGGAKVVVTDDGGRWYGEAPGETAGETAGNAVMVILRGGTSEPDPRSPGEVLEGAGVGWVRTVDSYRLGETIETLRRALDAEGGGRRAVVCDNPCMLAKKRRGNRFKAEAAKAGLPLRQARMGVDPEICSGDRSCMRLNGCPALTVAAREDPVREGSVTHIDETCAACSLCAEAAQCIPLCPSFHRARGTINPGFARRLRGRINARLLTLVGAS